MENQATWPHGVHYEIFVQSFADSDGDSIGDFKGLTSKLDYLQDLGIKGIWLMPIHPSPSYHKYDVTDYYDTHPDYGTLEEFKAFVAEAHQRDIRVIIDLVVNHTSSQHPWFKAALNDPESEYRDYYVWVHADSIDQVEKEATQADSDNKVQWHQSDQNESLYYGYFIAGMPDLNYDNPNVQEEIFKIGRFWLEEVGVDGFRLDAAKHIFPDDRPADNHNWWVAFREEMEQLNPDVLLVGEVWDNAEVVGPYLKGLHALFNFDLGYAITDAVQQGKRGDLLEKYVEIINYYDSIAPDFIDATFLTNHDQNRIMSVLKGNEKRARMAASLLLTLPGSPFIYYGEEIGMKGIKPDPHIREPFLWNPEPEDQLRAPWIASKYSNDSTVRPLSVQKQDERSLWHHYRDLIHFRHTHPVMQYGDLDPVHPPDSALVAYLRGWKGDYMFVVHNLSGRKKEYAVPQPLEEPVFSSRTIVVKNGIIHMPPFSTGIWTVSSH